MFVSKYKSTYGIGVHHIAYVTKTIEEDFHKLRKQGISLTSDKVIRDPLSNLKQFFISKKYAGYFIEIIQYEELSEYKEFTDGNMKKLASTMKDFVS